MTIKQRDGRVSGKKYKRVQILMLLYSSKKEVLDKKKMGKEIHISSVNQKE